MRKIIASAIITSMVAIPGVAFAHGNPNGNSAPAAASSPTSQSQRQGQNDDNGNDNAREQRVTIPGQATPVTIETSVALPTGSVSLNTAIAVAQKAMPGKTIAKVEIENENATVVYSVRFSDNTRVTILASNGTVSTSDDQNDDNDHRGGNQNNSGPGNNDNNQDDHGHRGRDD
jgi:uncharacterized membrane protein YkoI